MECAKIQAMVEPFIADELGRADKEAFVTHVCKCESCREELEVYHVIHSVISQFDNNNEEENIDYNATLERKLNRSIEYMRRRRIFYGICLAAGIISAIVLIYIFS